MKTIYKYVLVIVICVVSLICLDCSAYAVSGTVGDLNWTLDENGTLTIDGSGAMNAFSDNSSGWLRYSSDIKKVIIGSGVTSISGGAFRDCENLFEIAIPVSMTSIGSGAFYDDKPVDVIYNGTAEQWMNVNVESGNDAVFCGYIQVEGNITGICEDLNWTLDDTGLLRISGSGEMTVWSTYPKNWRRFGGNIRKVIIESGVTSICNEAFYNCINMTEVAIPQGVTRIGNLAFSDCYALKNVVLPDSLSCIDYAAFVQCYSLQSITIPNSVTTIASQAFQSCGLTSIVIPDSVTSIGYAAFIYCYDLSSVIIPDSVTKVGEDMFSGCYELQSAGPIGSDCDIQFGWTVIIPAYAFSDCWNLKSVIIPTSIICIDKCAFDNCQSLTNVYYDGSADQWQAIDIVETGNDRIISITGHVPNKQHSGTFSNLSWTLDENGMLTIMGSGEMDTLDDNSFAWQRYSSSIKKVVIGSGVTSISGGAFRNCENLTDISIPVSITSIGSGAFYDDEPIDVLYDGTVEQWMNMDVESGNDAVFCGRIQVEGDITGICGNLNWTLDETGTLCISGNGDMTTTYDPNGWRRFGGNIKSVVIETGVTSVSNNAFWNCVNMTEVVIPQGVTRIGNLAFSDCYALKNVILPDSLTCIDYAAFVECTSLQTIIIPNSVTTIASQAFQSCGLTSIIIPDSVTSIGDSAFIFCYELSRIIIPDSVAKVGEGMFRECYKLQSAGPIGSDCDIQFGWTGTIPAYAFSGCWNLKSVIIPTNTAFVDKCAFDNCQSLTNVYYDGEVEQWRAMSVVRTGNAFLLNAHWIAKFEATPTDLLPSGEATPTDLTPSGEATPTDLTLPDSGVCGDNVAYTIDDEGTMIISGNGKVTGHPWVPSSIKKIILESGVTGIGDSVFKDCTNLVDVIVADTVTSIDSFAFQGCYKLGSIDLPVNITYVSDMETFPVDFMVYTQLNSKTAKALSLAYFPFRARGMNYSIMYRYNNDEQVETVLYQVDKDVSHFRIPFGITEIGYHAFDWNSNLVELVIPVSVTTIGEYSLCSCSGMEELIIPYSVTHIDRYAFGGCSLSDIYFTGTEEQWRTIVICEGNEDLTNATIHYNYIHIDIRIPGVTERIESQAFAGIEDGLTVYIPNSVLSIASDAFAGVKMLTICGQSGSIAEDYAKEKGYRFINMAD